MIITIMPFQKGNQIWKGKKRKPFTAEHLKNMSESHKGKHSSPDTEFKKGEPGFWLGKKRPDISELQSGEKNVHWKGEDAGYAAKHTWMNNKFGRPKVCEKCGSEDKERYQWANISGEYKRERSDWMRLCLSCHYRMDEVADKAWVTKKQKYAYGKKA